MINKKIFDYLCCPYCGGELKMLSSSLLCEQCRGKYKIIKGVPILTNLKNLGEHYQRQILYFKEESKKASSYFLEEWQKSYIRRFDEFIPNSKNGMVVADIGTGSGYMAIELAKRGNTVLACDLNLSGFKFKWVVKA